MLKRWAELVARVVQATLESTDSKTPTTKKLESNALQPTIIE
jgi:hypothetical protein